MHSAIERHKQCRRNTEEHNTLRIIEVTVGIKEHTNDYNRVYWTYQRAHNDLETVCTEPIKEHTMTFKASMVPPDAFSITEQETNLAS